MMEAVATTMLFNLERERAERDEPDLRITNQRCEFRGYNLDYDFVIDNLGEKGTSIKNVKLVKIDDMDVDVDPDHMTYWVDGIPKTSYIMFINPRSTLTVNAAYKLLTTLDENSKVQFILEHTTDTLELNSEAIEAF